MDSNTSVNRKKPQHIKSFLRIRPLNNQEIQQRARTCIVSTGQKEIVIKHLDERKYTTDGVFTGDASQKEIYENILKPMISDVLAGYSCTVFAYGQTGSGKTYTIVGINENDPSVFDGIECNEEAGLIIRFFQNLFEEFQLQRLEYTVRVSFIELYNEEIFDLLSTADTTSRIRLYEDPKQKGIVKIHGVEEEIVKNKREVYNLLQKGFAKRRTAATLMNAQSSRSHTVFTTTVHIRETNEDGEEVMKMGKLNFVDLAGSEHIGKSGVVDKRARETGNINTSLLTLGRVIKALVEKSSHVPYRESKLTRILQDSLGGHTQTSIIATISPTVTNVEETLSTLDYANRARNITNRPEVNKRMSKQALVEQCSKEIEKLKRELRDNHLGQGIYLDEENYNKLLSDREDLKSKLSEKIQYSRDIEERIQEMERQKQNILTNFQEASQSLLKVSEDINNVKEQLLYNKQQVEEKNAAISAYISNEQAIRDQAQVLIQVADNTLGSENILRNKLSLIYKAADNNVEIVNTLAQDVCHQVDEVMGKMKEMEKNQSKICREIQEHLEQENTANKNTLDEIQTNLHNFLEICQSIQKMACELVVPSEDTTKEVQNEVLTSYQMLLMSIKDLFSAMYKTELPNLQFKFNEIFTKNSTLQVEIRNKIGYVMQYTQEKSKEIHADINKAFDAGNQFLEKFAEVLNSQQKEVQVTKKVCCEWEQKISDKLEMAMKLLEEVEVESREKVNILTQQYNNHISNVDSLITFNDELLSSYKKHQESIQINQKDLSNIVSSTAISIENCVIENNKELQPMLNDIDKNINCARSKMTSIENQICDSIGINTEKLKQQVEKYSTNQETQILECHDKIKEQMDILKNILNVTKKSELDLEQLTQEYDLSVREKLDTISNITNCDIKYFEDKLSQIHNQTEDSQELYIKVTHKGDTPCKTVHNFPQKIVSNVDCRKKIIEQIEEDEENIDPELQN